jgi:holliday junction DNA helicase RuvA
MIAFVSGEVAALTLTSAVVQVGGVGLELHCAPHTLASLRVGERATLPTSMVVREESLTLFGFVDDDEKSVFELLQTASGVGPKLAQAMLAVHRPDELRRALTTEDVKTLTTVPGIGQKGAQRIILELKDRIGAPSGGAAPRPTTAATTGGGAWRGQVHAGLVGLGWSAKEADRAVEAVSAQAEEMVSTTANGSTSVDVAALLRAALRSLSKA